MRADIYIKTPVEVLNKFYYSIYRTSRSCFSLKGRRRATERRLGPDGKCWRPGTVTESPSDLTLQNFTVPTFEKRTTVIQ